MVRKQASSDLSIRMSLILWTSSVSTRSKMFPTPAWWAEFRWTVRPVASTIPSSTSMDRWENAAMSSSFQPETSIFSKIMPILVWLPSWRLSTHLLWEVTLGLLKEGKQNVGCSLPIRPAGTAGGWWPGRCWSLRSATHNQKMRSPYSTSAKHIHAMLFFIWRKPRIH